MQTSQKGKLSEAVKFNSQRSIPSYLNKDSKVPKSEPKVNKPSILTKKYQSGNSNQISLPNPEKPTKIPTPKSRIPRSTSVKLPLKEQNAQTKYFMKQSTPKQVTTKLQKKSELSQCFPDLSVISSASSESSVSYKSSNKRSITETKAINQVSSKGKENSGKIILNKKSSHSCCTQPSIANKKPILKPKLKTASSLVKTTNTLAKNIKTLNTVMNEKKPLNLKNRSKTNSNLSTLKVIKSVPTTSKPIKSAPSTLKKNSLAVSESKNCSAKQLTIKKISPSIPNKVRADSSVSNANLPTPNSINSEITIDTGSNVSEKSSEIAQNICINESFNNQIPNSPSAATNAFSVVPNRLTIHESLKKKQSRFVFPPSLKKSKRILSKSYTDISLLENEIMPFITDLDALDASTFILAPKENAAVCDNISNKKKSSPSQSIILIQPTESEFVSGDDFTQFKIPFVNNCDLNRLTIHESLKKHNVVVHFPLNGFKQRLFSKSYSDISLLENEQLPDIEGLDDLDNTLYITCRSDVLVTPFRGKKNLLTQTINMRKDSSILGYEVPLSASLLGSPNVFYEANNSVGDLITFSPAF